MLTSQPTRARPVIGMLAQQNVLLAALKEHFEPETAHFEALETLDQLDAACQRVAPFVGVHQSDSRMRLSSFCVHQSFDTPMRLADLLSALSAVLESFHAMVFWPGKAFDSASAALWSRGAKEEVCEMHLSQKEGALLTYLLENEGSALSKEALLAAVWGIQADIETRTLETHIYRLRQRLEGFWPEATLSSTPGGYVFRVARS